MTDSPSDQGATAARIRRLERGMGMLLRVGVLTSLAVVLIGTIVTFLHHPEYLSGSGELARLTTPGAAAPNRLGDVVSGVLAGSGQAIVAFGLLLLMLTPVARVFASFISFIHERDWIYVLLTSIVLAMLGLSLILGRPAG